MTRHQPLSCAALLAAGLLAGCTAPTRIEQSLDAQTQAQEKRVHTDLVRGMLAQGQYYAALAHVQEQKNRGPVSLELQYLEAEALRKLARVAEADALYRKLLRTSMAGQAHHGMGLLYVERNLDAAIGYLRQAVKLRPTDIEARNDYGYALMLAGRHAAARAELNTAVELDPSGARSRNNLILLLIVTGDEAGARRVAAQGGVTEDALAGLRREAQSLMARPPKATEPRRTS